MSEFKNLPSGWKVVKLGEIGKIVNGLTYSPENVSNNGLLVLRSSNISDNSIVLNNDDVYVKGISKFNKTLENDILICVRNGSKNLIGKNALITEKYKDLAFGAFMAIFRSNYNLFLIHIFKTNTFFKQVKNDLGATINSINNGNLLNFKIPLPPLDEQKKIAEILSTWDEAINLTINLIESKKQFKKALMQNLLTAKIRFPQFKDEWQNEKLNKVTFFQEGPGVRNTQYKKEGIKLLNVGNLNNNTLNLNTTTTYISETEAYGAYKHFLIDDGDLLISCSGINSASFKNKIAFAEKKDLPLCLNTSTMRFKSLDDRLLLKYLYYFFQTIYFERQVLGVLTGSAQFNFGPTHIKWFKIKLPNLKEQQKIVEVLTACDDEINLLNLKLENLKKQKQGLMQKLLSGNIRTKVKGGKNVKMDD